MHAVYTCIHSVYGYSHDHIHTDLLLKVPVVYGYEMVHNIGCEKVGSAPSLPVNTNHQPKYLPRDSVGILPREINSVGRYQ